MLALARQRDQIGSIGSYYHHLCFASAIKKKNGKRKTVEKNQSKPKRKGNKCKKCKEDEDEDDENPDGDVNPLFRGNKDDDAKDDEHEEEGTLDGLQDCDLLSYKNGKKDSSHKKPAASKRKPTKRQKEWRWIWRVWLQFWPGNSTTNLETSC